MAKLKSKGWIFSFLLFLIICVAFSVFYRFTNIFSGDDVRDNTRLFATIQFVLIIPTMFLLMMTAKQSKPIYTVILMTFTSVIVLIQIPPTMLWMFFRDKYVSEYLLYGGYTVPQSHTTLYATMGVLHIYW